MSDFKTELHPKNIGMVLVLGLILTVSGFFTTIFITIFGVFLLMISVLPIIGKMTNKGGLYINDEEVGITGVIGKTRILKLNDIKSLKTINAGGVKMIQIFRLNGKEFNIPNGYKAPLNEILNQIEIRRMEVDEKDIQTLYNNL